MQISFFEPLELELARVRGLFLEFLLLGAVGARNYQK